MIAAPQVVLRRRIDIDIAPRSAMRRIVFGAASLLSHRKKARSSLFWTSHACPGAALICGKASFQHSFERRFPRKKDIT